jgi:hypothetical protein
MGNRSEGLIVKEKQKKRKEKEEKEDEDKGRKTKGRGEEGEEEEEEEEKKKKRDITSVTEREISRVLSSEIILLLDDGGHLWH